MARKSMWQCGCCLAENSNFLMSCSVCDTKKPVKKPVK